VLPGKLISSADALNWVAGQRAYPMGAGNEATRLVEAADKLAALRDPLFEQQLVGDTPPVDRTPEQMQAAGRARRIHSMVKWWEVLRLNLRS
jgi:hypothetical protein